MESATKQPFRYKLVTDRSMQPLATEALQHVCINLGWELKENKAIEAC